MSDDVQDQIADLREEMSLCSIFKDKAGLENAYRKLAKILHPDVGGSDAEMATVNDEVARQRHIYDIVTSKWCITAVLDDSASMRGRPKDSLIHAFNSFLLGQQEINIGSVDVAIRLLRGGNILNFTPLNSVGRLHKNKIKTSGNTPLLDGIGAAIEHTEQQKPDYAIILIITDGGENGSRKWTYQTLPPLIQEKLEQGWQFIYVSTDKYASQQAARFGIPESCIGTFTDFDEMLDVTGAQLSRMRLGEIKQITFQPTDSVIHL